MNESVVLWQARDLILSEGLSIVEFKGQSVSGVECAATGRSYSLLTNYGWTMQLAYLHWQSGEREVRAIDCNSVEHRMHDICHRVRMSVCEHAQDHDKAWIELSQARMTRGGDSDRGNTKASDCYPATRRGGRDSSKPRAEISGSRFRDKGADHRRYRATARLPVHKLPHK